MENLNKNANQTKEVKEVKTKEVKPVNVTNEIMPRLAKKYANAIAKVMKVGSEYVITFTEGYTIFGQTERKAKNIPGIMWYSRIATEEKEEGKFDMAKWTKYFNDNKVVWDGKNIPEYILTQEQIDGKAKKAKEPKTETKASK